jgi:hypothetical protein
MPPVEEKKETFDVRGGIRFGAGVAYTDEYGGPTPSAESDDYVAELPTEEEERAMILGQEELMDEGRAVHHPSTMSALRKQVRGQTLVGWNSRACFALPGRASQHTVSPYFMFREKRKRAKTKTHSPITNRDLG